MQHEDFQSMNPLCKAVCTRSSSHREHKNEAGIHQHIWTARLDCKAVCMFRLYACRWKWYSAHANVSICTLQITFHIDHKSNCLEGGVLPSSQVTMQACEMMDKCENQQHLVYEGVHHPCVVSILPSSLHTRVKIYKRIWYMAMRVKHKA